MSSPAGVNLSRVVGGGCWPSVTQRSPAMKRAFIKGSQLIGVVPLTGGKGFLGGPVNNEREYCESEMCGQPAPAYQRWFGESPSNGLKSYSVLKTMTFPLTGAGLWTAPKLAIVGKESSKVSRAWASVKMRCKAPPESEKPML